MPRLNHPLLENGCYFVTTVTAERRKLFCNHMHCDLLIDAIQSARSRGDFLLLGAVIMPDHLHIAFMPAESKAVSEIVKEIKRGSARLINMRTRHSGAIWAKGYWDRVVRDRRELMQKINYMHANPVRAGFVSLPEDWRYSSYHPDFDSDLNQILAWQ